MAASHGPDGLFDVAVSDTSMDTAIVESGGETAERGAGDEIEASGVVFTCRGDDLLPGR